MSDDEARTIAPVQFLNDPQRPMPPGVRDFTPKVITPEPGDDAPDAVTAGPQSKVYGGSEKPSDQKPIVTDTKDRVIAAREWAAEKERERVAALAGDTPDSGDAEPPSSDGGSEQGGKQASSSAQEASQGAQETSKPESSPKRRQQKGKNT